MPKTIYALFIGINAYPKMPLHGCINDVLDMHDFMRTLSEANADIAAFKSKFLLAPHQSELDALKKAGITSIAPATRQSIIDNFEHFAGADPQRGDICLLYFSGHGSFQDAPQQFWHQKPARQIETLVCVDSRQYRGRDLVDKELGYLIWKTMQGKEGDDSKGIAGVHFVAITDCCHSGDNTREITGDILSREAQPNLRKTRLHEYVGLEKILTKDIDQIDAYYTISADKKRIDTQSGSHIHLAAARENETAKEMRLDGKRRGIFTYNLLKTLRNGGLQSSYEQLIEEVGIRVKAKVDHQIPVMAALGSTTADSVFFNKSLRAPRRSFVIFYDKTEDSWKINAGKIHGIPVSGLGTNRVTIYDATTNEKSGIIPLTEVGLTQSFLAHQDASFSLQPTRRYRAVLTALAHPQLKLFINKTSIASDQIRALEAAISTFKTLQITTDIAEADYDIKAIGDDFILTKKGYDTPLFKREENADNFLTIVEKVANWQNILTLESTDNEEDTLQIEREDIQIKVEVIEGQAITARNIERLKATQTLINPIRVATHYKAAKDQLVQPALRLTVKAKSPYWVGGLYLSSKFGIVENIKPVEIFPDGEGAKFSFSAQGKTFYTLPLHFDKKYHKWGITETDNYIKIFVSTEPFSLSSFVQKEQELDNRSSVDKSPFVFENVDLPAWRCITIPLTIAQAYDEKNLPIAVFDGITKRNKLGSMIIYSPDNFKATIKAASERQVRNILNQIERSAESSLDRTLLPPTDLFGSAASTGNILQRSATASADEQLSILELDVENDSLSIDNQLVIQPEAVIADHEAVLPFGYDETTDLYIPVGYTNEKGQICIHQLPPASNGKIFSKKAINERSIGRSVKLFFKKVVLQETEHLRHVERHVKVGDIIETYPLQENEFASDDITDILLVVHGIIGSTEGQIHAAFEETNLAHRFDAVLCYDYENLHTPIEETAKHLETALKKAGLYNIKSPRLTIIAHSMGGLVSRVFIEQLSGYQVVKKLVMCGTPNGGSETGDFRKSIFGMLTNALNGAAILKPYLPILTFLGKQVGRRLFYTHNQMTPGSEFMQTLIQPVEDRTLPPYFLIAGDTSLISPVTHPDDPFWSKLGKVLVQRTKNKAIEYLIFKDKHNDIAVRITQMKRSHGLTDNAIKIVACDHMSYFAHKESLKILEQIIQEMN